MKPVRREPLVWVTSARHSMHLLDVLPLAVSHPAANGADGARASLDSLGRKYRIAYSSPNSNAVNAAVQSGLAVGAVPELCVRPGMRILGEKDGFPALGTFDIGLVRKPGQSEFGHRGAVTACDRKPGQPQSGDDGGGVACH